MYNKQYRQRGFTIVELLIAIAVIGILAVLVLNSFGDAQKRARNAQRISAAEAYVKILNAYTIQNNQLAVQGIYCLGNDYPDTNGDGLGNCGQNNTVNEYVPLENVLKTVSPTLPSVNKTPIVDGANSYVGIRTSYIVNRTVNNVVRPVFVVYWLEGSQQDCGLSGIVQGAEPTWTTGYRYTQSDANMTTCYASTLGTSE